MVFAVIPCSSILLIRGTTTITWTATDAHGNVSATPGIQTITVNDTEKPNRVGSAQPGCRKQFRRLLCDVNPGIATASDNCPAQQSTESQ
jgi:hypothetical protein